MRLARLSPLIDRLGATTFAKDKRERHLELLGMSPLPAHQSELPYLLNLSGTGSNIRETHFFVQCLRTLTISFVTDRFIIIKRVTKTVLTSHDVPYSLNVIPCGHK